MSTLLIALVAVTGYGAVLFALAYLFDRLQKNKTQKMLRRFKTLAAQHNLSVTKQDVWGQKTIGVDEKKGTVLYVEDWGSHSGGTLIDLALAKSCRIKKQYGYTSYLEAIDLEIDATNSPYPIPLPFYKHKSTLVRIQEAPELEAKARKWASLLTHLMDKKYHQA